MSALACVSIAFVVAIMLLSGCEEESATPSRAAPAPASAPERLAPASLGTTDRLHEFGDIWLASQPSPGDFARLKEEGVRTVIDQRPESEIRGFDERDVVTALGLRYENPGWNGPDQLTDEMIEETLDLLRSAERPVLMHCASANRTGAIWIVFRVLDHGLDVEAAVAEAKTVGLRTPEYERIAREYVERHR